MRIITIGEKQIGVRATPLALLYYRQEFKSDLIADLRKLEELITVEEIDGQKTQRFNVDKFDYVFLMQLGWAMAKADIGPGKPFPNFENWMNDLEGLDLTDAQMFTDILEEAAAGFFRQNIAPPKQRKNKNKAK